MGSMQIESGIVPPRIRMHRRRLSDGVKKMEVGQSFVCDLRTLEAFRGFCRYWGWESRQQKIDESQFRVWRTA